MKKLKTWQIVFLVIFYPIGIIYLIVWLCNQGKKTNSSSAKRNIASPHNHQKYPSLYTKDFDEVIEYRSAYMRQTLSVVRKGNQYILILPFAQMCLDNDIATAHDLDTDIVEASFFKGCCSECAKRRGRWFSLTGKNKNYPVIDLNYDCSCTGLSFDPVIEGISEPSYKKYFKRPMVDDRTAEELQTYNKTIADFKKDFIRCAAPEAEDFDFRIKTCTLIR